MILTILATILMTSLFWLAITSSDSYRKGYNEIENKQRLDKALDKLFEMVKES